MHKSTRKTLKHITLNGTNNRKGPAANSRFMEIIDRYLHANELNYQCDCRFEIRPCQDFKYHMSTTAQINVQISFTFVLRNAKLL